jgi:hypothetical protein
MNVASGRLRAATGCVEITVLLRVIEAIADVSCQRCYVENWNISMDFEVGVAKHEVL